MRALKGERVKPERTYVGLRKKRGRKAYADAVPGSRAEGRGERRCKQVWLACTFRSDVMIRHRTRKGALHEKGAIDGGRPMLMTVFTAPVFHGAGEED